MPTDLMRAKHGVVCRANLHVERDKLNFDNSFIQLSRFVCRGLHSKLQQYELVISTLLNGMFQPALDVTRWVGG